MSNMMKKSLYSVIIPTYNEAENLPVVVYLLEETSEAKYYCLVI